MAIGHVDVFVHVLVSIRVVRLPTKMVASVASGRHSMGVLPSWQTAVSLQEEDWMGVLPSWQTAVSLQEEDWLPVAWPRMRKVLPVASKNFVVVDAYSD